METIEPCWEGHGQVLYHAKAMAVLATLADASVDSVVTDPPYGLEFMGQEWDRFAGAVTDRDFKGFVLSQQRTRNVKCPDCGKWAYDHPGRLCECGGVRRTQGRVFQAWCEEWAAECLRVLKPGGHLVAFGGTRTYHRLVCALEDAGFEIRDSLHWLYGSGFPKSLDVGKAIDAAAGAERDVVGVRTYGDGHVQRSSADKLAPPIGTFARVQDERLETAPVTADAARWDGWGTALKPGHEPIVLARKPIAGTVAGNVLEHGTGAINVKAASLATAENLNGGAYSPGGRPAATWAGSGMHAPGAKVDADYTQPAGRWPPNVLLTHSAGCEPAGVRQVRTGTTVNGNQGPKTKDAYGAFADHRTENVSYADADGLETVEAWECAPGCPVAEIDRQSGTSRAAPPAKRGTRPGGFGDVGAPRGDTRPNGPTYGAETVEAWECVAGCPVAELDRQSAGTRAALPGRTGSHGTPGGNEVYGAQSWTHDAQSYTDAGGASRFYPALNWTPAELDFAFTYHAKANAAERPGRVGDDDQAHPTLKPLALMLWLVKLITPPGGLVLDPFAGTAPTLEAAAMLKMRGIGCDDWQVAIDSAKVRLADIGGRDRKIRSRRPRKPAPGAATLFDLEA